MCLLPGGSQQVMCTSGVFLQQSAQAKTQCMARGGLVKANPLDTLVTGYDLVNNLDTRTLDSDFNMDMANPTPYRM